MSDEMQQDAIDIASQALEKFTLEKDIAAHIKREFDKKHGPMWHCVVGRHFGSYVTHGKSLKSLQTRLIASLETKHFIYFYLGTMAVLLFKSG